jgi:hypothetical protein
VVKSDKAVSVCFIKIAKCNNAFLHSLCTICILKVTIFWDIVLCCRNQRVSMWLVSRAGFLLG